MANSNVIELGTEREYTPLKYVYVTIPAEYVCVYHRILAMLADYGVEMLKDCKASCKDRNSGVIECFNMFNAAVAARKLSNDNKESEYYKLSETLIKYIKAKINQIYKGKDNSTSFVFPVDETGQLKAFVSCGETPLFHISATDGQLYEHKFHNGFDEHFRLGPEDTNDEETINPSTPMLNASNNATLTVNLRGWYEKIGNGYRPCADILVRYNGSVINVNNTNYAYYFDDEPVARFNDIVDVTPGVHVFTCVIKYKGLTAVAEEKIKYEA